MRYKYNIEKTATLRSKTNSLTLKYGDEFSVVKGRINREYSPSPESLQRLLERSIKVEIEKVDANAFANLLEVPIDHKKKEQIIQIRLAGIDLENTCTRCGGSGHYSFNPMSGTRCFKCNGAGYIAQKLTKALYDKAVDAVEQGKLDDYFFAKEQNKKFESITNLQRKLIDIPGKLSTFGEDVNNYVKSANYDLVLKPYGDIENKFKKEASNFSTLLYTIKKNGIRELEKPENIAKLKEQADIVEKLFAETVEAKQVFAKLLERIMTFVPDSNDPRQTDVIRAIDYVNQYAATENYDLSKYDLNIVKRDELIRPVFALVDMARDFVKRMQSNLVYAYINDDYSSVNGGAKEGLNVFNEYKAKIDKAVQERYVELLKKRW